MKSLKVTQISFFIFWLAFIAITILTRFYGLSLKPIHFDESINGWFVIQMKNLGFYKYDPNNYHGPLYFYVLQGFESIWGRSIYVLRAVPAVFSVLSVVVFTFGILKSSSLQKWMALFLLMSPSFLFFGRSGIHEMPFVFFQIVFALGILRWHEKFDAWALLLTLFGLWGMVVLKETFAITLLSWIGGFLCLGSSEIRKTFSAARLSSAWNRRVSFLLVILLALWFLLFTGFFKNPSGLGGFFKAFMPWLKTGVHGHGHEKSVWYWLDVFWKAEPLVLLGIGSAFAGMFSNVKILRMISVFALCQLLIYSLIPYKTVWCLLSLAWPFYLVLAMTISQGLKGSLFNRITFFFLGVVFIGMGLRSSYVSVYKNPIDFDHPFVYVNSTLDYQTLENFILSTGQKTPALMKEPIQIGMKEQWPWPWVLNSYEGLDYNLCSAHLLPNAAIYFCDLNDSAVVESKLSSSYWKVQLKLRQSREESVVYFRQDLFPQTPLVGKVSSLEKNQESK